MLQNFINYHRVACVVRLPTESVFVDFQYPHFFTCGFDAFGVHIGIDGSLIVYTGFRFRRSDQIDDDLDA